MNRRNFLVATSAAGAALVLEACATAKPRGVYETTEVPAPVYRVGDTWTYRRTDGYNGLPRGGVLTRTVTAIDGEHGIRIETRSEQGALLDDAIFQAPGLQLAGTFSEDGPVIGRCETPYRRYDFPLAAGKHWQQSFYLTRTDLNGNRNYVNVSTRAEGWENVNANGHPYHALILRRALSLGQKTFFEGNLYRDEIEWYAPQVRGFVRWETREVFYRVGGGRRDGGGGPDNGDRFVYELLSFKSG